MIISHDYKFIFLKTNKTAGTSIEIALSKFCGPNDIITPISPEDEETRRKLGYRGPQNFRSPFWDYGVSDVVNLLSRRRKPRFYNHMTAQEVKHYVREDVWHSYFKFCFERNPWDRVVSLYYWRNPIEPRQKISDFIDDGSPLILKKKGCELYTIDEEIVVDRLCKYESLHEELEAVREHVGLPGPLELPSAKSGYRKDTRNYRDILGEDDKEKIAELFSGEISLLQYEW